MLYIYNYMCLIDVNFSDIKTMTASAEKPSPKKKGGEMKTKVVNFFYVNMPDPFFLSFTDSACLLEKGTIVCVPEPLLFVFK
jgi:hypothetical protein